ncbi:MAG: hypothetical protein KDB23_31730, partial [Planctomycetales bacterium]|nr:hypothetical protein [Planctomycetales bacterium]
MIRAVLLLLLMMMACSQLPAGVPAFDVQAAWSQPVEQVQEQECSDANADEASETQATERPVVFDEQITVASYGTAGTATVDDDLAAVVQQEVSQLVWRKGDIRVTPYGILWTDAILSTNRTFPGNFIL